MDSKETRPSMASQCDKKPTDSSCYEDDSFETAEESIRSSHSARGRRESVFLAESSTSSEESQESAILGQTKSKSCESTPRLTATDSASTPSAITEEQDYSDQFESIADNFSEVGSSIKPLKVYMSVRFNNFKSLIIGLISLFERFPPASSDAAILV